jgi:hypothetical protein
VVENDEMLVGVSGCFSQSGEVQLVANTRLALLKLEEFDDCIFWGIVQTNVPDDRFIENFYVKAIPPKRSVSSTQKRLAFRQWRPLPSLSRQNACPLLFTPRHSLFPAR